MKIRLPVAALALAAGACFLPAAEVTCGSAESMDHLMGVWTEGFTALHPETPARVTQRARFSADLTEPLARGELQVAPYARELFPAEQARFAELAGGAPRLVPVATGSRATKGGTHAIAIFVNERNPLTKISLAQLREIFARDGHLTTWGQLGLTGEWAARKITVHGMRVRRETGNPPGIVNFLEARLLGGPAWRADLHEYTDVSGGAQSLEQITRAVAADEGGIGYSGFGYAVPGVKTLALGGTEAGPFYAGTAEEIARRDYPLARMVYLALGPAPEAATVEFVRHVLSPAGQAAIAADGQGFYPLTEPMQATARALLAAEPELPAYDPLPVPVPGKASYITAEGAVAVIGYNDMDQMLEALGARFTELHPAIRFSFRLPSTRAAPPALARGESAFAPMGAEFSPTQLAEYRAATGGEPREFRVAHCSLDPSALSGPLAIIVPSGSPLTALTLDEVAGIFSGRDSRGLHAYGLTPETALALFLRRRLLDGEGFGEGFRGFAQSRDVVTAVTKDPQGIGFTAAMRAMPGVKSLGLATDAASAPIALTDANIRAGRYPLDRFLLIYARQPLEPVVREFLRFVLSREGQEVIARGTLGYLPLNPTEAAAERAKLQ